MEYNLSMDVNMNMISVYWKCTIAELRIESHKAYYPNKNQKMKLKKKKKKNVMHQKEDKLL